MIIWKRKKNSKMTTNWLFYVAVIIGFIFVYRSNKKVKKNLTTFYQEKEKKKDEDIYENR